MPLEVALMKQVNVAPPSPYILQMLEWFDQPTRYVMVLERPEPCQDLIAFCHDRGGTMGEETARPVMVQLLRALCHCQERGVLHRDVKPENLLIQTDSYQVKLFDFGCGDLLKNTAYKDFAGQRQQGMHVDKVFGIGPCLFYKLMNVALTMGYLPCPWISVRILLSGCQYKL